MGINTYTTQPDISLFPARLRTEHKWRSRQQSFSFLSTVAIATVLLIFPSLSQTGLNICVQFMFVQTRSKETRFQNDIHTREK